MSLGWRFDKKDSVFSGNDVMCMYRMVKTSMGGLRVYAMLPRSGHPDCCHDIAGLFEGYLPALGKHVDKTNLTFADVLVGMIYGLYFDHFAGWWHGSELNVKI